MFLYNDLRLFALLFLYVVHLHMTYYIQTNQWVPVHMLEVMGLLRFQETFHTRH
jgi:hypothetical protein